MKYLLITVSLILLPLFSVFSQSRGKNSIPAGKKIAPEQRINFDNKILGRKLDYDLLPSDQGSFKLRFINNPSDYMNIKIFDVIGNLILTESVMMPENSEKIYYFEDSKNKIYIIKVESGQENLIKKISL